MLETAEIGSKLGKEDYKQRVPGLREELITLQRRFADCKSALLIVVEGDDRPGCDDVINLLHEWLDPRFVATHAFLPPSGEELERPRFWRYWLALPPRGRIGVFSAEWTLRTVVDGIRGELDDRELEHRIGQIRHFEKALSDDGAVILKFWLHLPKGELKKRLKAAEKHPERIWRSRGEDKAIYKRYFAGIHKVEYVLQATSSAEAPWNAVESRCPRHRNITVGEAVRDALRAVVERQARGAEAASRRTDQPPGEGKESVDHHTILDTVDLAQTISREDYAKQLRRQQTRLGKLAVKLARRPLSAVLLFEGWDAAGKGGAIRRLAAALNAQMYDVVPVAAPTDEERARQYLWRFWRHLPRAGRIVIFDRTWYGRVLVERVEGFATRQEWSRAYSEINDFEEQLLDHGMVVCKFWLHIDKDEQLRRFKEREKIPFKRYKITQEDYRNRERWNDYELAVNEMVARTSTPGAPWHVIPSNDKRYARVRVIKTVADAVKKKL